MIKKQTRWFTAVVFGMTVMLLVASSSCSKSTTEDNDSTVQTENGEFEKGEQVVKEYLKRDFAPYRKSKIRLTVKPKEGKEKVYVLETWRKQIPNKTYSLTHMLEPAEDRNVATLTIEKNGEPARNISYIGSRKQFRESSTNKLFFGGLTSQELLGEWDKYKSRLISKKEDKKIFEIESMLKKDSKSVIKRIVTHFGWDDYLPRELHLFNSEGKELRAFIINEFQTFNGKKMVSKTTIRNHIYKATIIIEVLEMSFPKSLPDKMFERESLKNYVSK